MLTDSQRYNLKMAGYRFKKWGDKFVLIAPDGFSIGVDEALSSIEAMRGIKTLSAPAMYVSDSVYRNLSFGRRMTSLSRIDNRLSRVKRITDFRRTKRTCPCGRHAGLYYEGQEYCPVGAGLQLMRLWLNNAPSIAEPGIINKLILYAERGIYEGNF